MAVILSHEDFWYNRPMKLRIRKPDDFHIHLRDGAALATTVPHCAQQFGRALVMPNLAPPVTTVAMARDYRQRIMDHVPAGNGFTPLMSLYLTDTMSPQTIAQAKQSDHVFGCKLYPAGATTNSDSGVTDIKNIYPVLEAMQQVNLPLLVHGEVTDHDIDIFDREKVFLDTVLSDICKQFPQLRIVVEHITTKDAVQFVLENKDNIAATITAHHLLINRNDMLVGGIKPHNYCLPVVKRQIHQQSLIDAATSASHKFFLGTDSAPHNKSKKECATGCAGIYTAHCAIPLYASVFEQADKLDQLEAFASIRGAQFYQLPLNEQFIELEKKPWQVPNQFQYNETETLIPFHADQTLQWQVV